MRDPFEKRIAGDKDKPQLNSSQERNYWSDLKTNTRARADFFAYPKDVRWGVSSRTSHCKLSQKTKKDVHYMFQTNSFGARTDVCNLLPFLIEFR